jgi:NAD(P)-dependent dehydrogenase (short-subunit alcohol dehydrogenase family)
MQVVLPQKKPVPKSSLYSATKGAIDTLTMALAKELGPRNIRVNTVAPGLVDTEGNRESGFVDSAAGNAGAAATAARPEVRQARGNRAGSRFYRIRRGCLADRRAYQRVGRPALGRR